MFKIGKTQCTLGKINMRPENHGEEKIPACDIPLTLLITRDQLNSLCGGAFASELLFNTKPGTDFPEPACPQWNAISFKVKFVKCKLTLWLGLADLKLGTSGKFSGVSIEPQAGGMSILNLKMQCEWQSGMEAMFDWMSKEVSCSLTFGEVEEIAKEQMQLPMTADANGADPQPAEEPTIGELQAEALEASTEIAEKKRIRPSRSKAAIEQRERDLARQIQDDRDGQTAERVAQSTH